MMGHKYKLNPALLDRLKEMDVPYFAVEEDDFNRSLDYIESLKVNLKQDKTMQSNEDNDEVDDQWLDDIIQSVFTDGQKATFKVYLETFSRKNKMARGDVRSLFEPQIPDFSRVKGSTQRGAKSFEGNHLSVTDGDIVNVDILRKHKINGNRSRQLDPNIRNGSLIELGPCLVHHLGPRDMHLLRGLAETEVLTVFMQNGGVKVSRLQSKRKPKDVGVFGVPLQVLLERDMKKHPNVRVPLFLSKLISMLENHVQEEGILRVSGSLSRIKDTALALETDDRYLPILNSLMPHDLSGLLKQFLRDLPHPIFTLNWLDGFCKAFVINDEATKLHAFQCLFCLLPDVNRATLQLVFGLLHKISSNSSSNKMTADNVSMTIGPTLFLVDSSSSGISRISSSTLSELDSLAKFVGVTSYLLKNVDKIWAVPPLLLKQIRQINYERDNKKKRSADRRAKSNVHPENTFENVFIHSCHPDFPSLCLKFSGTMTVADVLDKFNRFKEPYFRRTTTLFETGGSIDHQVLSTSSNISEVLDENPHARFYFCRQSPDSLVSKWPQFY